MRIFHVRKAPKVPEFTEVYEYGRDVTEREQKLLVDGPGFYDLDSDGRLLFNINYTGYRDIKYRYFYEFFLDVVRDEKIDKLLN